MHVFALYVYIQSENEFKFFRLTFVDDKDDCYENKDCITAD